MITKEITRFKQASIAEKTMMFGGALAALCLGIMLGWAAVNAVVKSLTNYVTYCLHTPFHDVALHALVVCYFVGMVVLVVGFIIYLFTQA